MITREPLLTKEQFQAWTSFGHEWGPFKDAWLGRGFLWPPEGDPRDDPRTSLRSRLWEIANARPDELGEWVREAKGRTAHEVVAHVFGKWLGFREVIEPDDEVGVVLGRRYAEEARDRNTWTRIGDILQTRRNSSSS